MPVSTFKRWINMLSKSCKCLCEQDVIGKLTLVWKSLPVLNLGLLEFHRHLKITEEKHINTYNQKDLISPQKKQKQKQKQTKLSYLDC